MNALNNPNSVYQPSGEHATPVIPVEDARMQLNQAAQEMVVSAFASMPNADPTARLERAVGPKPDEVIMIQELIGAQRALRKLALDTQAIYRKAA